MYEKLIIELKEIMNSSFMDNLEYLPVRGLKRFLKDRKLVAFVGDPMSVPFIVPVDVEEFVNRYDKGIVSVIQTSGLMDNSNVVVVSVTI